MKLVLAMLMVTSHCYPQGVFKKNLFDEERILDSASFFAILTSDNFRVVGKDEFVGRNELISAFKLNRLKWVLLARSSYLGGTTVRSCPSTPDFEIVVSNSVFGAKNLIFSMRCPTVHVEAVDEKNEFPGAYLQLTDLGAERVFGLVKGGDTALDDRFITVNQLLILDMLLKYNSIRAIRRLDDSRFFSCLRIQIDGATSEGSQLKILFAKNESRKIYDSLAQRNALPEIHRMMNK